MAGALNGIKVLDLSRVLAGPWATQILADMGADVAKVERPGSGDDTRAWGPPYARDASGANTSESAYFLSVNRAKQSIAVDIADPEGAALVRRLAARADVVVENFKVGGLARYGLDYDSLKAVNPRLVYCSITGFGQTGPYRQRPGYDYLVQGLSGLMSITGEPDGPPEKVGVALIDILTGLYAVAAILAALMHRQTSGEGQYIDLALFDVGVATLANQASNYLISGKSPARLGNAHPNIVPYETFATADGYIILAVGNDGQFARFCAAAGQPGLAQDPRYVRNADRVHNRETLVPQVAALVRTRTTAEWQAALDAVDVPCSPINTIEQAFHDVQALARGLAVTVPHPLAGAVPLVANPIRFSATPIAYEAPPPTLGQHSREIVARWLGAEAERS